VPFIDPFSNQPAGSVCSAGCTVGEELTCGWSGPGTPADAVCFKDGKYDSGDYGDVGQCVQLCDCSTPCTHPNQVCTFINDGTLVQFWGHGGYCTAPLDATGQPVPTLGC
jgi:hypothetical protein